MFVRRFRISNFRSLKEVPIGQMEKLVIFHGPNNTGKSNILAALETIFKRKVVTEEIITVEEKKVEKREQNFWHGELENFADNFFENKPGDIVFEVLINVTQDELDDIGDVTKVLTPMLARDRDRNFVEIKGSISMLLANRGRIKVAEVNLNKKKVFVEEKGSIRYLPSIKELKAEKARETFENFMGIFNDAYKVIPCNRYLTSEVEHSGEGVPSLLPESFKNWLFKLSLEREGHDVYQRIRNWFNNKPFSYGDIGFARIGNNIEILK